MDDRKYTIQILIIHKMDFLYFHSHAPSIACRSLQRQRVNLNCGTKKANQVSFVTGGGEVVPTVVRVPGEAGRA